MEVTPAQRKALVGMLVQERRYGRKHARVRFSGNRLRMMQRLARKNPGWFTCESYCQSDPPFVYLRLTTEGKRAAKEFLGEVAAKELGFRRPSSDEIFRALQMSSKQPIPPPPKNPNPPLPSPPPPPRKP